MSYLATPIEKMGRAYDVVVVGSGYGGAINASRLARAGLRVCILERGEEFQPGDFPEGPTEGMREVQLDMPDRRMGSRTALFDFRMNADCSALIGCGLGGTSLINANVAIKPDERVWRDPRWPEAIRADVGQGIEAGYERALAMLRPSPYPEGWPVPHKMAALERSAAHMKQKFMRAPITVNFEDQVENHVGVPQPACNGCGNCVGGCNTGAKSNLLANYLPDAVNHGAEIYTKTSVRRVERKGDGWLVRFELIEPGAQSFGAHERFVAADTVIISAGALGSTEILLRSRDAGLPMSDRVGAAFTGNGDVLGFSYNSDVPIHGVGIGAAAKGKVAPGPCISGIIDFRGAERLEDTMVIEEGAIPSTLNLILASGMFAVSRMVGRDTDRGLKDYAKERYRELQALVPGGSAGSIGNTLTFLVMSQDDAGGRIELVNDRARIDWPGYGSQEVFKRVDEHLYQATAALGGTFMKNPLWAERMGKSMITVHPLGGCAMGDTAETGAVDHEGRVFAGRAGGAVHDGLYVSDGAVIPRALGINPFLTISALAERTAEGIARRRGASISYELPSRPRTPARVSKVGIQFTEAMRGFWMRDALDYAAGAQAGEAAGQKLEFTVTVSSDDLETLLKSPEHTAALHGQVTAPALSAEPLTVSNGVFQLLTRDEGQVRARNMNYRMPMSTHDGRRYLMSGFKEIKDDKGLDLWSDTTTLYVTVHEGADETGRVLGRGILKIQPRDFARQMGTLKVTNAGSIARRLKAMADFGMFFAGSLYETYGGVFARRSALAPDAEPRSRRELAAPEPETWFLAASDGVQLRLLRYPAPGGRPVLLLHGLGVSGRIFSTDTVDENLVERLAGSGYDVWVLDSRASIDLPMAADGITLDQIATRDVPAALAKVREVTGVPSVDVVAHGFGAMTFLMGMLEGAEGVRSAVCLGAGLHLVAPRASRLKAGLYLPGVLKALGAEKLTAATGEGRGWKGKLLDVGLRMMPVEAEEWCTSQVCRRVTFMYGHMYEHDQLNMATHDALHELFGDTSVDAFEQVSKIVREQHAVRTDGTSYLRGLDRLAFPILFVHGGDAATFLPESTQRTVDVLREANPKVAYRQVVVPDYGDLDCLIGKNAAQDVFPLVLAHLEGAAEPAGVS